MVRQNKKRDRMKAIFNLIMNILGIGKAYYMFGMNKPHPMWTKFFLVFPYPWKSYACLYCSNCSYSVSRHQGKFPTAKSTPASLPPAEGPNGKIGRPHYTLSEDFKRAPHIYADMRLNWMNSGSNYRVLYLLKSKQY